MVRKYAKDTTVAVSKSRGEIDNLLREWGAIGVQWTDEWSAAKVTLRFQWPHGDHVFSARMIIRVPTEKELRPSAMHGGTGVFLETKMAKLLANRGKQEHRLLLILIKATLNAVDAGVITDVEAFLPYLEGKDGRTVGEVGGEHLELLTQGSAVKLLGA